MASIDAVTPRHRSRQTPGENSTLESCGVAGRWEYPPPRDNAYHLSSKSVPVAGRRQHFLCHEVAQGRIPWGEGGRSSPRLEKPPTIDVQNPQNPSYLEDADRPQDTLVDGDEEEHTHRALDVGLRTRTQQSPLTNRGSTTKCICVLNISRFLLEQTAGAPSPRFRAFPAPGRSLVVPESCSLTRP